MAKAVDSPPPPPGCGTRLLSHVIDERAQLQHSRPFASIPRTDNVADGYVDVSYETFGNAVNKLAKWITEHVGPPSTQDETLIYVAPGDLRYQIVCMAAVKAGYIVRNRRGHSFEPFD